MPARQPEADRRSSPAPSDTVAIGPAPYVAWRSTGLGAITEALEQRVILELVGEAAGHRVLDAGCGDGTLACELAANGVDVTGVDADPAMLLAARERAGSAGLEVTWSTVASSASRSRMARSTWSSRSPCSASSPTHRLRFANWRVSSAPAAGW